MTWVFLSLAIASEVTASLSLRAATHGPRRWYVVVVTGYVLAFAALALALDAGMGLGVAYGTWAAAGVALTALLSKPLFGEPLTPTMLTGIGLIMVGVLLIELGAEHA